MLRALALARRGFGATSPNPMVGAVVVHQGKIIGRGWHRRAGWPHAEIEALRAAQKQRKNLRGATLYVTLEPCSTHGRTPPCTDAIIAAGIRKVVVGVTDPNPNHAGRGFDLLRRAGVEVVHGILAEDCARLNEVFNHWIVHRTPFVTVKAAMTLDGKIATADGESKWITGPSARAVGMKLRQGADAVVVGINTILADDPSLTFRPGPPGNPEADSKSLRRLVLDSMARTPWGAKVVCDKFAGMTTIVASSAAPKHRVAALEKRVNVLVAPAKWESHRPRLDLRWLMTRLGSENVTSLLVEGGGETNAEFLFNGLAHRVAFFYAPRVLGGIRSRKAVAGEGAKEMSDAIRLRDVTWKKIGEDLMMTAMVIRP
jgi:diaminohydroxyphosphoribosylaminopyrimidine deaminase / 5-amino-6-(5-phosphoribosylamino)uracil reductase